MVTEPTLVEHRWRWLFLIEVPICLATAGFWLLAPNQYVSSAYGVDAGDLAHIGLLRQLAFVLVSMLGWFYGRWLLSGSVELRPFRFLQEGLALGDMFIIAGAIYATTTGELDASMAVAQMVPAGIWLAVRVVFLLRYANARASQVMASASRS